MVTQSRYPYAETIARLSAVITAGGGRVFATIDQAEAAARVGMSLRPTTLLLFGNPKAGTPLMDAFPLVALELPLKLLIWEEGTRVSVAYVTASEFASRYGVTGMDATIAAMDRQLEALSHAVA
jgi:uncharacterized protein (DUF302 family)